MDLNYCARCIDMLTILTIGLLTVCLSVVHSQMFSVIEAIVNDPVTLQCGIVCPSDASWSIFLPIKAVIARCDKETCRIEAGYQKRFTFSGNRERGNISLFIRSVAYNDIGSYRCSCDGKTSEVKLKVFFPTVILSGKLENITLPCYGDTRMDVKDIQWKKDGQTVLLYNHLKRTLTASESRFRLSEGGFEDGDLSLHISSVQQSDAGLYRCTFQDESQEGDPPAVLLKVEVAHVPEPQVRTNMSAVVNDPVTLPCVCSGVQWMVFSPTKAIIAACVNGTCHVEDSFQERFTVSIKRENRSLLIKHVVYSDAGTYRCSCDGHPWEVNLEVLGNRSRYGLVIAITLLVIVLAILAVIIRVMPNTCKTSLNEGYTQVNSHTNA